ncbi:hypothetical protein [Streptomyces sp. BpilaLS-43]|nr:hypothetical protein [Streptomyces sp. BpilaLS-43]
MSVRSRRSRSRRVMPPLAGGSSAFFSFGRGRAVRPPALRSA